MGLRPIRQVGATNNELHSDVVMERGGIVSIASGQKGSYSTEASGAVPIGILLNDVEDLNYFNQPQKLMRSVTDIGGILAIATEGEFETDFLDPAVTGTINAGQPAFLSSSGWVTTREQFSENGDFGDEVIVNPRVGVFTKGDHTVRGASTGWARIKLEIKQGASTVTQ
jgi:hypothetical protein